MGTSWITPNESYIAGNGWGYADANAINNNLDYIRNQNSTFIGSKTFEISSHTAFLITASGTGDGLVQMNDSSDVTNVRLWTAGHSFLNGGRVSFGNNIDDASTQVQIQDSLAVKDSGANNSFLINSTAAAFTVPSTLAVAYSGYASSMINTNPLGSGLYVKGGLGATYSLVVQDANTNNLLLARPYGISLFTNTDITGTFLVSGGLGATYSFVVQDADNNNILLARAYDIALLKDTSITGTLTVSGAINTATTTSIGAGLTITAAGILTCSTINPSQATTIGAALNVNGTINTSQATTIGQDLNVTGHINPTTTPTSGTWTSSQTIPRGNYDVTYGSATDATSLKIMKDGRELYISINIGGQARGEDSRGGSFHSSGSDTTLEIVGARTVYYEKY